MARTLFNNETSQSVVLAALDSYVSVLQAEIMNAKGIQLIIKKPPQGYAASRLIANNGNIAKVENLARALLRKTVDGGSTDGKSYQGKARGSINLRVDLNAAEWTTGTHGVCYTFADTYSGFPFIKAKKDVVEIVSVSVDETKLVKTLDTSSAVPTGHYRWSKTGSKITFPAGTNSSNIDVVFRYTIDHEKDAALRHILAELQEHAASGNLLFATDEDKEKALEYEMGGVA